MRKIVVLSIVAILTLGMTSCCRPCRKAKPAAVKGVQWGLLELNDKVIDRNAGDIAGRFTLTLGDDGRIGGKGDCNTYFSAYTLNGEKIDITGIASTRMLCPNQSLEDQYFRTLESAVKANIDGRFLILMNSEGKIVASFEKISE